ncbi:MAG: hypothetical protein E6Q76_02245 [Rhizobium sp.]|nr:MAG: hypothetical protein E6Q76_02245 [Rhizobium sp.]
MIEQKRDVISPFQSEKFQVHPTGSKLRVKPISEVGEFIGRRRMRKRISGFGSAGQAFGKYFQV